jgi:hypothetical protein
MVAYGTQLLAAAGPAGGALAGTYPNPSIAVPLTLRAAGASPVFGAGTTGDTANRAELRASGVLAAGPGGATPPDTTLTRFGATIWQMNGALLLGGTLDCTTPGNGIQVAEGANAKQGTAILGAGGTVTVANTSVTASSRIQLTGQSLGTVSVPSAYAVSARTPGTSFTILASSATDTSTIAYEIFEPG